MDDTRVWRLVTPRGVVVTHGQAPNLTCQSYAGCHSSVPSLQKLAVCSAEALEELEAAILSKSVRKAVAAKPKRRRGAAEAAAAERKRLGLADWYC